MNLRLVRFAIQAAGRAVKTDFAQNLARDLKSLRALWNWLYMALYVWICIYAVLYHPETIPTAITVTGGVVSVIFTGYVCTKAYERVKNGNHRPPAPNTSEEENEFGD